MRILRVFAKKRNASCRSLGKRSASSKNHPSQERNAFKRRLNRATAATRSPIPAAGPENPAGSVNAEASGKPSRKPPVQVFARVDGETALKPVRFTQTHRIHGKTKGARHRASLAHRIRPLDSRRIPPLDQPPTPSARRMQTMAPISATPSMKAAVRIMAPRMSPDASG